MKESDAANEQKAEQIEIIEPKEHIEVKPSQKDVKLIHESLQSIHGCIEKL